MAHIDVSNGLDEKEVLEMLDSDAFAKEAKRDEEQARSLGVRGVPSILSTKY